MNDRGDRSGRAQLLAREKPDPRGGVGLDRRGLDEELRRLEAEQDPEQPAVLFLIDDWPPYPATMFNNEARTPALAGFTELTGWPDRLPAGPFLAQLLTQRPDPKRPPRRKAAKSASISACSDRNDRRRTPVRRGPRREKRSKTPCHTRPPD